jgi:hypothetical protein
MQKAWEQLHGGRRPLLAGVLVIPGTGERGKRGKRRRTTRGFRFTSYLWPTSTGTAGILPKMEAAVLCSVRPQMVVRLG